MKLAWPSVVGMVVAISASAQTALGQATQMPPLQQQWRQEGLSPGRQSQPGVPAQAPPAGIAPGTSLNTWLPAGGARLQALDKVNAQGAMLTVRVGQSVTFGSITIVVKACMTRPADHSADAAAFIGVTDSHPDSPGFDGWMLQAEPAVSMMQHPIYDLRVTGCV